jgi:hypothetical protein
MKVSTTINDLLFRLIDGILSRSETCPRKVNQKQGTRKGAHMKGRKREEKITMWVDWPVLSILYERPARA